MIISLRGPSGAGKSTLARAIFMQYDQHIARHAEGRKKPYYVTHGFADRRARCLVVPGHYEIGNGGVDTLLSLQEAYDIARWADKLGHNVLMEGKCMSDGTNHIMKLVEEGRHVLVMHIDTSVADCIASVQQRGHNIKTESIIKTDHKVRANIRDITSWASNHKNMRTFSGNRDQCLQEVQRCLGLS